MSARLRKYTEHKVYGPTISELRIHDDDRIGDGIILSRAVPDPCWGYAGGGIRVV